MCTWKVLIQVHLEFFSLFWHSLFSFYCAAQSHHFNRIQPLSATTLSLKYPKFYWAEGWHSDVLQCCCWCKVPASGLVWPFITMVLLLIQSIESGYVAVICGVSLLYWLIWCGWKLNPLIYCSIHCIPSYHYTTQTGSFSGMYCKG